MAHVATGSVVRQLGTLFEGGSVAGLSDRQLLERYTAGGRDPAGEAAFAALVGRHGPMVLGICRQLLGDVQHAEDAFQAVFLVLARKARSIRDPDLLGNWLYGVAIRTARCARQQIARRRRREEGDAMKGPGAALRLVRPAEPTAPPADRPAIDREQAEAIHGEIDRLPRAFRLPVVLCYFEGLTLDEAARRLRCPAGTLHSRLARAREKLRSGLARRGVVLPAAALAAVLAPRSASASVPPLLCDSTTRAAIGSRPVTPPPVGPSPPRRGPGPGGPANHADPQAEDSVVLTVLFLGGRRHRRGVPDPLAGDEGRTREDPAGQQSRPAAGSDRPDRGPVPGPGRMFVTGRRARPGRQAGGRRAGRHHRAAPRPVGCHATSTSIRAFSSAAATTDADGRFRLDALRTSADGFFESTPWPRRPASAWAGSSSTPMPSSPGRDPAPPRAGHPWQAVDVHGQPAAGVELRFGAWAGPPSTERTTASAWAIPRRRRDSASGRGPSRPTTRADSPSPASVATSLSASTSATDDSRAEGFRSAPTTAMVRKPSRKLSGPR